MQNDLAVHVVTSGTLEKGKLIEGLSILSKRDTHMVVRPEGFVTTGTLT